MPYAFPFAPVLILIFFMILLFPQYSVEGASDGLLLWFHTVLPALAPAMIFTRLILDIGGASVLMRLLRPLFSRIFSLSEQGSFILFCGMLCGYPVGPSLCSRFLSQNQISEKEASYLLALCSYPSPMFLFGYVRQQLKEPVSPVLLFLGIYAPVFLLSAAAKSVIAYPDLSDRSKISEDPVSSVPVSQNACTTFQGDPQHSGHSSGLDSILYEVCDTMVLIGGYMMLFSILVCFIRHAEWIPPRISAILCGIFEMTTGIHQICQTFPAAGQLLLSMASAAFGGISGIFQVKSVLVQGKKNAGFDIRHYIGWKLLHAGLSMLMITVLQLVLPLGFPQHW